MGFLNDYFGNGRNYLNLAEKKKEKKAKRPSTADATSTSKKSTKETIKELLDNDWFTFATVNIVAAQFSRPPIKIVSDDKEQWENFFENMRLYGNSSSIRRLRHELKRDAVAFGAGYLEFIPSEDGEEMVDLKRIDAGKIHPAKDKENRLVLDEQGKSIGYIVDLGPNADTKGKGDTLPPMYEGMIHRRQSEIFLLPSRVAELPIYTKGNGIEPIGLVEPCIKQTQRRQKLEDAQVNAIWIRGTAPLFSLVGDKEHEPTAQMIDDALDSLEEMKHSSVSAFPFYAEPKTIDANVDDMSTKIMENLMYASAGSASTPLPFITGAGEATNRSTLKTQREMFESNIQIFIDNFDEDFNLKVMAKIAAVNGYKEGKIESGSVRLEAKDEFAKRLKIFADLGAISPKEIRETLKDFEDIKFDDEEFEKYNNDKKKAIQDKEEKMNSEETEEKEEEEDKEDKKKDNKNTTKE
ncbi:MAG: hypothetical protein ACOC5T_08575 [Elusimicrobiota bacterium]